MPPPPSTSSRQAATTATTADPEPFLDPVASAKSASLRYVSDGESGFQRRKHGTGVVYLDAEGARIDDDTTLERIRTLAIPPAWEEVWICPFRNGHLQATGRDARGRKQYRYHARWRRVRDETKYERLIHFGAALPTLRAHVDADLAKPGLPREKILATIIGLLETTFVRVGNEEYARTNGSFGLTTLRDRHVRVEGTKLYLRFRGKSGKSHDVKVSNQRLAKLVKRCRDLPGQILFQYLDDGGEPRSIHSNDVNDYLRETTGQDFTAKDWRTWAGTLLFARHLRFLESAGFEVSTKSSLLEAISWVAGRLGNTPAICRKCYIHPALIQASEDRAAFQVWCKVAASAKPGEGLEPEEAVILRFLEAKSNSTTR